MAKVLSPDLSAFSKDWKRLQAQKWRMRGGVEARMILNLATRYGEMYVQQARDMVFARPLDVDDAKNKLSLVFNLINKQRNRKIGHLYRIANEFRATPDTPDPTALDTSEVVNKLRRGLDRKIGERMAHWKRLSWLVDTGVVIEHIPWVESATTEAIPAYDEESGELLWRDNQNPDPTATLPQSRVEQMCQMGATPERFTIIEHPILTGDVGSEIISGLNFFIDASVPQIKELGPDQACYIAQIKTIDWIADTFGAAAAKEAKQATANDLAIIRSRLVDRGGAATANMNMRDLLPAVTGSSGPDDPPMTIILTRYQPSCRAYARGRRSILTPFGTMLDDGAIDYGEVPLVDFHYEAPTANFWTKDFLTDMIPANKFLNKRMSQLGEMANAQIYETLLLGQGLTAQDIPSDMAGVVQDGLGENGEPQVVALQHGQPPSFFLESIKLVIELLQTIGAVDMLDHPQMPGQIRGPMVLPLFQEIVDSEDAPLYEHLAEQLALVHQQRINRVKQYYPPMRTLHYTGRGKRDEVLVFHTDAVLRSGVNYQISFTPGSIYPEFAALKEARIIERLGSPLAGLYTDARTGKIDYSKIAWELKFTDDDDTDRAGQYRLLAEKLIARLWAAEQLSVTMPEIPYPFWDHRVMLDELEASMATTEWLEASAAVKQEFVTFYEKCRSYLAAIQDAQAQAAQGAMMQSAVAQAAQQTAAKVASTTADAAMAQIQTQGKMAQANPMANQIASSIAQTHAAATAPQVPQAGRIM